jgi:pteridine reductase
MIYPIALVTGASDRLGKAFALSLARQGYAILLHYNRSEAKTQSIAREIRNIGLPAYLVQADLTMVDQIDSLFSTLDSIIVQSESQGSYLNVLVNSASIMPVGRLPDVTVNDWDLAINVNLRAPFLCAQAAAKRMTHGGLIVNIADIGAQKVWSLYPSYVVSKAALEAMTRISARAFAPAIRVNAIAPGLILPSHVVTSKEWERLVNRLPLKRAGREEEITSALEFLIQNEYITGQTIVADGGYSLI